MAQLKTQNEELQKQNESLQVKLWETQNYVNILEKKLEQQVAR